MLKTQILIIGIVNFWKLPIFKNLRKFIHTKISTFTVLCSTLLCCFASAYSNEIMSLCSVRENQTPSHYFPGAGPRYMHVFYLLSDQ